MVLQHKSGHGNLLGVHGGEPAAQEGGIKEGTKFSFNNWGHVICWHRIYVGKHTCWVRSLSHCEDPPPTCTEIKSQKVFGEERLEENWIKGRDLIQWRAYICFIRQTTLPCLRYSQGPTKWGVGGKKWEKAFPISKSRSFQKGSDSRQEGHVKCLLSCSSGQWRLILSHTVWTWSVLLS